MEVVEYKKIPFIKAILEVKILRKAVTFVNSLEQCPGDRSYIYQTY